MQDPRQKEQFKELAPLYMKHAFWDTQPVAHMADQFHKGITQGEIEKKEVKDVKTAPYALPEGFEWSTIDLTNEKELTEVFYFCNGY
jgi:glycylpeptide N-tetradecanoyltransferase